MEKGILAYYNEYSSGSIKLRDIPLEKINRRILIRASEIEPKTFIEVVLELYQMNRLTSLGLNIRQCLELVSTGYKTQDMYFRLFKINPLKIFRLIPNNFLTQDICDEYFRCNPCECFRYIPHKFRTKEMYEVLYKDDPVAYFNNLPNKYKTQEMCDEYALKYLLECFEYMPDEYKTQDMCNRFFNIRNSFHDLWLIPDNYKTQVMWEMIVRNTNDWKVIKRIPREMLTQWMCDVLFDINSLEVFENVPDEYKTVRMCKKIIPLSDIKILKQIPKNILNQELCNIIFDTFLENSFDYIPDEFKTQEMCMIMCMYCDDTDILKKIPKKLLNQRMYDILFARYSSHCFEDIPNEFRTKEMYISLLQEDVSKFSYQVPIEFYDTDILGVVIFELKKIIEQRKTVDIDLGLALEVIKLYPYLIKALSRKKRDEIITGDLYSLISNGGTLKSISKKYDINVNIIAEILEKMKDKDMNSYMLIRKILETNEDKYFIGMINDIYRLGKIVLSLGDLKQRNLNSEQKIKFAYLYNKYVYHSLEEIYAFNKRFNIENFKSTDEILKQDIIRYSNSINEFFGRSLKFNYVFPSDTLLVDIPEVETILLNNSWLKKYDREKFFGIKDGVSTILHKYGKDEKLLTLEIEENIISRLKDCSIPLNDYIVQLAFREYFNGKLDEYMEKFLEYDKVFEGKNIGKKR